MDLKLTHEEMCEAWEKVYRDVLFTQFRGILEYCICYSGIRVNLYDTDCSTAYSHWYEEMEELYGED